VPTLPPEPEKTSETSAEGHGRAQAPHLQRQIAEGFGSDAGRYDRARPAYPAGLVERIIAASPGRDVLDVGCGTGIAARLFQEAGCRVLGVDPDPRMAGLARRGGTETETATFEDWDPAGRMFDAVIAAQAWHWVDPVAGAAKAAGVLRPGGRLTVFWNAFAPPQELGEAFGAVCRRALPGSPLGAFWEKPAIDTYRTGGGRAADGMRRAGGFSEPEEWLADWSRPYTRRSGWTSCGRSAASPSFPGTSGLRSWPGSARPSTRRAAASPWATPRLRSPPSGWRRNPRAGLDFGAA
jgi:SAM-dependent methyltransferase